ncbi:MAG: hypothetical protein KKG33_05565 [candidate division Zixibacteria bacterium]|nr:hypothetical protein [candidate division Zixibacteria bacterium]MBU1470684.1 hypothetical protein [candidate division Zixibacteria bacterium]MBU2625010.1 hypothetical protein [candidate division Zixibacteria bacterium]
MAEDTRPKRIRGKIMRFIRAYLFNSKGTKFPRVAALWVLSAILSYSLVSVLHDEGRERFEELKRIHETFPTPVSAIDYAEMKADLEANEEAVHIDPSSFFLSSTVQSSYKLLISIGYFLLALMTIMMFLRFGLFVGRYTLGRPKFYPKDVELSRLLEGKDNGLTWLDLQQLVFEQAKDPQPLHIWRIMGESISSSTVSAGERTDVLLSYTKRAIDRLMMDIGPQRLYDAVAAASPAVGFTGTLLGLLYIFSSSSQLQYGSMGGDAAFNVGLRIAIVTSLWGLANLTLAVLLDYFTGFLTDKKAAEMENLAKSLVEKLR